MAQKKKNWGLEQKSFPKHKQWSVDQDYTDQLDDETAAWLSKFNDEYYRNKFVKDEPALHKDKKECYSRENARNRDLYAIKNVGGAILPPTDHEAAQEDISIALVEARIDLENSKKRGRNV